MIQRSTGPTLQRCSTAPRPLTPWRCASAACVVLMEAIITDEFGAPFISREQFRLATATAIERAIHALGGVEHCIGGVTPRPASVALGLAARALGLRRRLPGGGVPPTGDDAALGRGGTVGLAGTGRGRGRLLRGLLRRRGGGGGRGEREPFGLQFGGRALAASA